MNFFKLNNQVQNYAWGSKTAFQTLFSIENPNQEPQAELWMGAHTNGCSTIHVDGKEVLLSDFINKDKSGILSSKTKEQFGELPFLFKVLAAENALSIQVHPSKEEAEEGFAKEEELGIERFASNRNYRDPNHKPELVYALTPYQAMNGFRPFVEIVSLFSMLTDQVDIPAIRRLLENFREDMTSQGLEAFFSGILSLGRQDKDKAVRGLIQYAEKHQQPDVQDDLCALILKLEQSFPNDIGLFAPLILNVITLAPGEAMYLDARTPHAYLKGTALEIMANSDNVLRAGLTPKHIDVVELTKCTLFEEKSANSILLEPVVEGNKQSYPVPVQDFKFDCFMDVDAIALKVDSAEIVFAIDGDVLLEHMSGETMTINKGQSVFIPAYAKEYKLTSKGRVARAYN